MWGCRINMPGLIEGWVNRLGGHGNEIWLLKSARNFLTSWTNIGLFKRAGPMHLLFCFCTSRWQSDEDILGYVSFAFNSVNNAKSFYDLSQGKCKCI